MNIESTREFMITNRNLNSVFKPNNINGKFTYSTGLNGDAGIKILDGNFNHQSAIIFDIIYDQIYRMFNEIKNMNYIHGSLTKLLTNNDDLRKTYFTTLLTDKKLDFYFKLKQLMGYFRKNKTIPFNKDIKDFLQSGAPDIIDNAFPLEFSIAYKNKLESNCEREGNFDSIMELIKTFDFDQRFFIYLLHKMFYGRIPSWNNFNFNIDLHSIFENSERSTYSLKKWFMDVTKLKFAMTYPITCFSDCFDSNKYLPKKLFLKSYMFGVDGENPIQNIKFDKANMRIKMSLLSKFMVFFAHDAKLCVRTIIPSSLYKLGSNPFFIGKYILNNNFYNKKDKEYKNILNYSIKNLFQCLNLEIKDIRNNNNSHRRKAIFKALDQLNDLSIIKIDKMTSERVILSRVWNINYREPVKCNDSSYGSLLDDKRLPTSELDLTDTRSDCI